MQCPGVRATSGFASWVCGNPAAKDIQAQQKGDGLKPPRYSWCCDGGGTVCSGNGELGGGHVGSKSAPLSRAQHGEDREKALFKLFPGNCFFNPVKGCLNSFFMSKLRPYLSPILCLSRLSRVPDVMFQTCVWQPGTGPAPGMCSLLFLLFLYM